MLLQNQQLGAIDLSQFITLPPVRIESGADTALNNTLDNVSGTIATTKQIMIAMAVVGVVLLTIIAVKKARS